MVARHGPCFLTLRKESSLSRPSAWGNFSASPTWSTGPTTESRARSSSLWAQGNLFWQLSRDGISHDSGMSHATTASPKPSFRAPWRVGDAVLGRGFAGWTTSKSGHPCPCQNFSQQRLEEDLCSIVRHIPPTSQSTKGPNWTDVQSWLNVKQQRSINISLFK